MFILDYIQCSARSVPDKMAYVDEKRAMDYKTLKEEVFSISYVIAKKEIFKSPIAIYMDKNVESIACFFGVACSGNFYTPIDTNMPRDRVCKILETLQPKVIITDTKHMSQVSELYNNIELLLYEDMILEQYEEDFVNEIANKIIDTDILYVLFTSGSTGVPKGVIISHKSLIDFIEWGTNRLSLDENTIFGNQTPFYFSMSVFDIYETIKNSATMYIIPHEKFSLPAALMDYLAKHKINTIFWVPSALTMVSALHALNEPHLDELKNVFFGGEVMPMKQLIRWREEYPNTRFVNFYGPTEVTDTCTIYEVNRTFDKTETLPMGYACDNMDVFLLDEEDNLVNDNSIGEVCVRGTGLAYGYYNDVDKTSSVFVQNPLNKAYSEVIYRTGDLAYINEYGEFVYAGRKDFQIKHMGHRIELGEIETSVLAIDGIDSACCLYDDVKSKIIMYYTGDVKDTQIVESLKNALPSYMMPNVRKRLDEMPYNLNGKIDRQKLKALN